MNKTSFQQEQAYKAYAREVETAMGQLGAPSTLSRSVVSGSRDFIEGCISRGRTPGEAAKTLYGTYARR
jgi:hypothetical protein